MGVMLSLDQPGLARNRRQARHARRPDEQAWADVLAAIVRDEPLQAGCLVRLAKNMLAGLLIPADSSPAHSRLAGGGNADSRLAGGLADSSPAGSRLVGSRPADSSPGDWLSGADHQPVQHAHRRRGGRVVRTGRDLSGACLLGQCQDSPGAPACASVTCQHDCHGQVAAPAPDAAEAVSSVA
jgi:hypothetical protein